MKQRLQGMVMGILLMVFLFNPLTVSAASKIVSKSIKAAFGGYAVQVDGKEYVLQDEKGNDLEPFTYNGVLYAPVELIADALDSEYNWDEKQGIFSIIKAPVTQVSNVSNNTGDVEFNNYKTYLFDREFMTQDTAGNVLEPISYKNNVYVPIKSILYALKQNARWDEKTGIFYFGTSTTAETTNNINSSYLIDIAKSYQTSGFGHTYKEYSSKESGGKSYFQMAGEKYYDGAYMQNYGPNDCYSLYNIGGRYKTLNATLGHIDDTSTNSRTFSIYGDDILLKEVEVSGDMVPTKISIDVTDVLIIKIELSDGWANGSEPGYGLGNITLK